MERFDSLDDVTEYVYYKANNDYEEVLNWDDCKAIAESVSEWNENLQKYDLIVDEQDFWLIANAYALIAGKGEFNDN